MAQKVVYDKVGGADELRLIDYIPTQPGAREVRVAVRAAGVNPVDWKIRSGAFGPGAGTDRTIGFDAAGTIEAVGADVTAWQEGDNVILADIVDAYSSNVVTSEDHLLPIPTPLSFDEAAAIGVPAGTAYQAVRSLRVSAGDVLLVHGGAGAVGQAAIQFARRAGATVIATASPQNHERLTELGAIPVAYGDGLTARLRTTAGVVTAALDAAGSDEAIEASLELVADRSRIGTIVRGADASTFGIRAWSGGSPQPLTNEELQLRRDGIGEAARLAAAGEFDIEIAARFPLGDAAAAHTLGESGLVRGKIVLLP
ncbi:zinc-binding alcohol dehydrogenase family protein [Curtobacterium sp. NPDC089689]|uniref:quinone oxidoreductase family protein n=1 Tax=Curtobacterium sp. NPDC089689 TaxID=3363968 RepID=UPI00382B69D4